MNNAQMSKVKKGPWVNGLIKKEQEEWYENDKRREKGVSRTTVRNPRKGTGE